MAPQQIQISCSRDGFRRRLVLPRRVRSATRLLLHYSSAMSPRYCEVALPVPLRSTFTYAVPESLDGEDLVGRRVVVPFRNRAMIGLSLGETERAPEIKRIKEVTGLMDRVPALQPKLIELGHWISRYYVAPIGETFRSMLPPEIELRSDREYSLTDAGRAYLQELSGGDELTGEETAELQLLRQLDSALSGERPARRRRVSRDEKACESLSAADI